MAVESQFTQVAASGFAPIPKAATLADLIVKYRITAFVPMTLTL